MFDLSTTSEFLGYTSIACWLGAQLPQVLENIRQQSCEGLALPFLANWLAGDFSNLIGCILTHQLPFQTWLATYFVFVDVTLLSQYIYYSRRTKSIPASLAHARRMSVDRGASRYRTLSAVAANVAAAAALAAQRDEHLDHRHVHGRWQARSTDLSHDDISHRIHGSTLSADDVDDDAMAALADSFISERGHEAGQKRVSWSIERSRGRSGSVGTHPAVRNMVPTAMQFVTTHADRGRPTQRDADLIPELQPTLSDENRRSSRASRKGTTMVFLGACTLFGFGAFATTGRGFSSSEVSVGRVLSPRVLHVNVMPISTTQTFREDGAPIPIIMPFVGINVEPASDDTPDPDTQAPEDGVLGRIFAWLCTTLYLTSRLPQIWKNYVRKSVEGLSMYLFVFAFLGNVFYVASILTSPKVFQPPPLSTQFIKASIPYLLGSSGTLVFDITIVAQSFVYKPHARRRTLSRSRNGEEESGLLAGESSIHS